MVAIQVLQWGWFEAFFGILGVDPILCRWEDPNTVKSDESVGLCCSHRTMKVGKDLQDQQVQPYFPPGVVENTSERMLL